MKIYALSRWSIRELLSAYVIAAVLLTATIWPAIHYLLSSEIRAQRYPTYEDLDWEPSRVETEVLQLDVNAAQFELGEVPLSAVSRHVTDLRSAIRSLTSSPQVVATLASSPSYNAAIAQLENFARDADVRITSGSRADIKALRTESAEIIPALVELCRVSHQLEGQARKNRTVELLRNRELLGTGLAWVWISLVVLGWFLLTHLRNHARQVVVYEETLEAKRRALDAAREAEVARNAFLGKVSHEINSPLQAIMSNVQLMEHRLCKSEAAARMVGRLKTSVRQLCCQVDDLLGVAEMNGGRLSLKPEITELLQPLQDVVAVHQGTAESKGIRLLFEHEGLGLVYADARRLSQILTNLVTNAIRYTDKGAVTVHARMQPYGSLGKLTISVSDTGLGIAPEAQARLFEPFSNTTSSRRGTGLGLAIVKGLVDEMRGCIQYVTVPNEGTTFTVTLVVETRPERREHPRPHPDALQAIETRGVVKRLLYVEDNPVIQETLGDMLLECGYHVDLVSSVAEAATALKEEHYAVVLVDMELPDGSGLDVSRHAKASRNRNAPLIAVTAYGELLVDCEPPLFAARLRKPVDISTLQAALVAACGDEQETV